MQAVERLQFYNGIRPLKILSPKSKQLNTLIEPLQTEKVIDEILTETEKNNVERLEAQEAEVPFLPLEEGETVAEEVPTTKQNTSAVTSIFFIAPSPIQSQQNEQLKMTETKTSEQLLQKLGWVDIEQKTLETKFRLKDPQLEKHQAIAELRRHMSQVAMNANENVVNQLIEGGLSLEKLDIAVLAKAMQQVRLFQKNVQAPAEIENQVGANMNTEASQSTTDFTRQIQQTMMDRGIAFNENNLHRLEMLVERVQSIQFLDQNSMLNLIKERQPLTLENIYRSQFSTKESLFDRNTIHHTKDISRQQNTLLENNHMDLNTDNIPIAQLFREHQIPVNNANINKYLFLKSIKEHLQPQQIVESGIRQLRQGQNINAIPVFSKQQDTGLQSKLKETYQQLRETIPQITAGTIATLLENNTPVTLENLRNYDKGTQNTPQAVSQQKTDMQQLEVQDNMAYLQDIQRNLDDTVIRQLVQQQRSVLEMNLGEAAQQLQNIKNIDYAQSLKLMGGKASAEKINLMATLYQKMAQMTPIPSSVYQDVFNKTIDFNINSIANANTQAKLREGYESAATKPDRKYGDSYRQVQPQIQQRLVEMGLPNTKENQQAYEILSKNQIETTMENINEMKLLQMKVHKVVDELHPNIAAKMLHEGMNPLQMPLEQVLDYMDQFQEKQGTQTKDRLEAHLLKLDKMKVSEQQRNAIVAVYRALNQITRNNSVALGVAMKNGTNVTLGNLLEASKYFEETRGNRAQINVKVDENFGLRQKEENQNQTIRTLLEKEVQAQRNKQNEAKQIQMSAEQLAKKLNPENYVQFTEQQLEDKTIEELNDYIRVEAEDRTTLQEKALQGIEYANQALQTNPHLFVWLQASGMPITINNIHLAQAAFENNKDMASAMSQVKGVDANYENWT